MPSDDTAWIALSLLRHVGGKTLRNLITTFGDAETILNASEQDLRTVKGVGKQIASQIRAINTRQLTQDIRTWCDNGVTLLPSYHAQYPAILRTIDDEPPTLFSRGKYTIADLKHAVAIVGTRRPSVQGRKLAFQLGAILARQGWVIVSGLALGVDAAAHHGALSVRHGATLAVLGSGVLNVYPKPNETLAAQILQRGALLSENHPQATPNAPRLVSRNRIISGLCQHTIIVESTDNGGAMYTARAAQAQGRTVHTLALPNSGNQALIAAGANVIPLDLHKFTL